MSHDRAESGQVEVATRYYCDETVGYGEPGDRRREPPGRGHRAGALRAWRCGVRGTRRRRARAGGVHRGRRGAVVSVPRAISPLPVHWSRIAINRQTAGARDVPAPVASRPPAVPARPGCDSLSLPAWGRWSQPARHGPVGFRTASPREGPWTPGPRACGSGPRRGGWRMLEAVRRAGPAGGRQGGDRVRTLPRSDSRSRNSRWRTACPGRMPRPGPTRRSESCLIRRRGRESGGNINLYDSERPGVCCAAARRLSPNDGQSRKVRGIILVNVP